MKIWSDTLSRAHMYAAARKANVDITREIESPARKRAFRWDIALSGDSSSMQGNGDGYRAATWDQWGIFLAELFKADPSMTTEYYVDSEAFHAITDDRFTTLTYEEAREDHPKGRHDWRYMPIGRVLHYVCNGCTAENWPRDRKNQPMTAPTSYATSSY